MPKNSAKIEERQSRVFDLAIQGFSAAKIATLVGAHRETVASDIAVETARRGAERSADRAALIEQNVSHYERLVADSTLRVSALQAAANAEPDGHVAATLKSIIPREVLTQLKAREQAAKTLGLFAPIEVDLAVNQETQILRAQLLATENILRARTVADQREAFISGERTELPDGYA